MTSGAKTGVTSGDSAPREKAPTDSKDTISTRTFKDRPRSRNSNRRPIVYQIVAAWQEFASPIRRTGQRRGGRSRPTAGRQVPANGGAAGAGGGGAARPGCGGKAEPGALQAAGVE